MKTNQSTRLLIDTTGRVGINNENPAQYLPGDLTVGNSSKDQYISVVSGEQNAAGLCFQDTIGASIIAGIIYQHTNNHFEIWTAASKQITVDEVGRLGIRNEDPDNALSVQVTDSTAISAGSEGNVATLSNDADGGYVGIKFDTKPGTGLGNAAKTSINSATISSGTSIMTFATESGGVFQERMRLGGNGKLGIGVTSPAYDLHTASQIQVGNSFYHFKAHLQLI